MDFFNTLKSLPKTIKLVLKIEKKYFAYLILLSIIVGILPIINLFISQEMINSLVNRNGGMNNFYRILTLYIMTGIMSGFIMKIYDYIDNKFSLFLGYRINDMLMNKISTLSLRDFESPNTYNIIEKIMQESSYKPFQITKALIAFIIAIITLISTILYISIWDYRIAFVLLVVPVVSLSVFIKLGQLEFVIKWNRAGKERKLWYWIYLMTHDFSFKEIKLNGLKKYIIDNFLELKMNFINEDLRLLKRKSVINLLLDILLQAVSVIIILFAAFSLSVGKILIGSFVGIIRAIGIINDSSQEIIQEIYIIYNSSLYMKELFEFLNYRVEEKTYIEDTSKNLKFDSISISNLSFNYKDDIIGLKDINLDFNRGELIAIVGKNGSGKSTLVKLLCGLYLPTSGTIKYDGYESTKLNAEFFSANIAVLFQDYTKFELSLRENVAFGNIKEIHNDKKIIYLLNLLNMDYMKTKGVFELDIQLGNWFNGGRQLSGGEWQRIALARTFIKEANLYILDEPNSALDPTVEKYIFDTFTMLSKKAITIFITHDISVAQKADKIIVMEKGKIAAVGRHDELLKKCDEYKMLYNADRYK
jgi:nisin transport ATP-binding protein nisT